MHVPEKCPKCQGRAKRRYEERTAALRSVSATKEGRDVLDYILDQSGIHSPSLWDGSSKIHYMVAYRDFGMWLLGEIKRANRQGYYAMEQERDNKAEVERLELEKEEKHG